MKCNNCGADLGANDVFCSNCGTPVQKESTKSNDQNENMYTYERNVNQQQQQKPINQNYGQANNYGQPYQKTKNAGDIVKICIGTLVGIIILAAIVFIIYSVMSALDKKNNDADISNNPTSTSSSTINNNSSAVTTPISNNQSSAVTTSVSNNKSSSYKVNYAGFKLYIPDNLIYEMDYTNDAVLIGDAERTWITQFLIKQGSFEQLKKNKNQLRTYLLQEFSAYNANVKDATIETIGGVEFILLECEAAGEKMLIGYAGLNSMYSACFTMTNEDNNFNRDLLKDLATIIDTAEYTGDSQYLKTNENIKLTDVNKAFEKTMEANKGK